MEYRKESDLNIEVFGNSVIWRHLSKYLKLEDLLSLRATNRFLYDQVSDSQSFATQMAIHMKIGAVSDENFLEFIVKYPKWKSLAVTLHDTKHHEVALIESYYPLMLAAEMKRLKFYWKEGFSIPSSASLGSVVFGVIAQAPQVTKFEIEFLLLARIEFWSSGFRTKEILKNVTDFKIFQGRLGNLRFRFPANYFKYNMRYFETVFFQLKNLTIEELPDVGVNTVAKIHLLIKNNCFTLKSLILLYPVVWHKTRMAQIICPKLKKLHTIVKVGHYHDTFFKAFLRNHSPLEDISVTIDGSFDPEVLFIIKRKHSKILKALHIKTHKLGDGVPLQEFFQENTGLQEFSLDMTTRPGHERTFGIEDCESLLQYLPPTIHKLKFGGLHLRPTPTFSVNRLHFSRLTKCTFLTTLQFIQCTGLSGNRLWIKDLGRLKGIPTKYFHFIAIEYNICS